MLEDLSRYADRRNPAPPLLPLIGYYGTGRLWASRKVTEQKSKAARALTLQVAAYVDCLSPASNYLHFALWFENVVREAQNERLSGQDSPHKPSRLLAGVRRAIDIALKPTGWTNLDWDFLADEVVATHPEHGRLPVSLLSDGIRNLIALVADLAHRAVRLNPHLGEQACAKSPGVVLIDEVDMHLHPAWQQQVISLLRDAFPKVQWIVTTHSSLVISTVNRESIRIIADDGTIALPAEQTQGADSPYALGVVFGVSSIFGHRASRESSQSHAGAGSSMPVEVRLSSSLVERL